MRRLLALLALCTIPTPSLAAPQEGERAAPRKVAILLYPGVELLDFAGPGEVFAAARGDHGRGFEVFTVAESAARLRSQGFVDITPRYTLQSCPAPDLVVIPGGGVPLDRPAIVSWLREVGKSTEVMFSVCNGALLLAKTGMLDGLEATTHHGAIEELMLAAPKTVVHDDRRFVDNGRVVTAAGVSAGIDGALHVVSRLLGEAAAVRTARYMEYRWEPEQAHAYQSRVVKSDGRTPQFQVVRTALKEGVEAARVLLEEMPEPPAEMALNRAGYALLQSGHQTESAIVVFELIAAAFPDSANAWDSLADGLVAAGRNEEALRCTRRCLELIDAQEDLEPGWRERVRESAQGKLRQLDPGVAKVPGIGDPAPEFELRDTDDGVHRMADLRGRVVVLEWTSDACPAVKAYYQSDRLPAVQRDFGDRVVWLSVDSSGSCEERVEAIRRWRSERGAEHPYLLDADGSVGRAFGAATTPEVFVIDGEGRLAYTGAIDDLGPAGGDEPGLGYLADALRAVLAGQEVSIATTRAVGCSIAFRPGHVAAATGVVWKCPPCSKDCHDRDYDRAGRCAECGMWLITKAQYDKALAEKTGGRGGDR